MKRFQSISQASGLEGYAACLGNFDGVHLGHQALFSEARRWAKAVAITFHPHPGKVLVPELAPKLITGLPRKLELFEHHGLDAAIVQPFSLEYARSAPEEFERSLFDHLRLAYLVVGSDFTYGRARAGTISTLEKAAAARGAQLHVVQPVCVDGVVVSSTKVREYVLEGRVSAAHRLLGRYFDLDGIVVRGQGRGRKIGVPTANVDTENELRPAPGVYAVRSRLEGETRLVPGAANIGVKPTFGGTEVTIEVHHLDWTGELYGKKLRVEFIDRLRDEARFGSVEELAAQIRRDLEAARTAIARAD